MKSNTCVLTERGQVSVPVSLRRKMRLHSGQKLRWERLSENELRVVVEPSDDADPLGALGYGPRVLKRKGRRTTDWMREIRDGE